MWNWQVLWCYSSYHVCGNNKIVFPYEISETLQTSVPIVVLLKLNFTFISIYSYLIFLLSLTLLQEKVDYLEDGKNVFRIRLRLCSSLYPISERIRDFFLEYDRHILRTSPPWGSELLEVYFFILSFTNFLPLKNEKQHTFSHGVEILLFYQTFQRLLVYFNSIRIYH